MATLDGSFEDDLQAAVLDAVETEILAHVDDAIEASHARLREFADEYDVEPVIDALQEPTIERRRDRVRVVWGWDHPGAPFFALGTSPHTIEGDPVLSFIWEDAPPDIQEQFEDTFPRVFFRSVDVEGVDETRFVRAGLEYLQRELQVV